MPSELSPRARLQLVERLLPLRRGLRALTLGGGEPLLLDDLEQLVVRIHKLLPRTRISLSTSGLLLSASRALALARAGVDVVQLTLLSARPETHDEMVGQQGAHEQVIAALAAVKQAGMLAAVFFVATRRNIGEWPGAARLALALGADALMFNRFQPGGRGLTRWRELTPTPEQLDGAMTRTDELRALGPVQLGTALPPCELSQRPGKTDLLRCPIGTRNAYPTIGPDGALRPCNHWPTVLGSLLEQPLARLLRRPEPGLRRLPPECVSCRWARRCGGGCPAARALAGQAIYARRR